MFLSQNAGTCPRAHFTSFEMKISWLLLLSAFADGAISRVRRQAALATEQGVDVPITLRSLITCLTPGIREHICLGPRVEVLKKEDLGLTPRKGAAYGYRNGVDLRLLKPLNAPLIEEQTEIGHSLGAVVDVTDNDGVVEFGNRGRVFKAYRHNSGGVVEWDRQGAGVDIGHRISVADDLLRLKVTNFGINVGPTSSRSLVGPGTTGRAKGEILKPSNNPIPALYRGYYNPPGDWYRNQFIKPGDEYRTAQQRGCPWCFAVDPTHPVQKIFPWQSTP